MVKIVNGVVVSDSSAQSASDSADASNDSGTILLCGYRATGFTIFGIILLALFLGGVRGAVFAGGALGVAYFFSNDASASRSSNVSSSTPSSFGSNSRIRGVKDLPKAPAKC